MREATIEERGIVIKLEYIQLITEVAKLAQFVLIIIAITLIDLKVSLVIILFLIVG